MFFNWLFRAHKGSSTCCVNQCCFSYNGHYTYSIRDLCWVELIVPFQLDSDICQLTVRLAETASGGAAL